MTVTQELENLIAAFLDGQADRATLLTWVQEHVEAVFAAQVSEPRLRDLFDAVWLAVDEVDAGRWTEAAMRS